MKKSSFSFKTDDAGIEFVELSFNEKIKNHQVMDEPHAKPRMYDETGTDTCPLKSLKLYISKLNPNFGNLYAQQVTAKSFDPLVSTTWYTCKVLGVNSISKFKKNISKRLDLSAIYTNHSIRATLVTLLSANGVEARQIMRMTGRKFPQIV